MRPFLAGVFCEAELRTSSRFFDLVWRCFARGSLGVPAAGMGAIPDQLARALPPGTIRLTAAVSHVGPGTVALAGGGQVHARAVVVATDGASASRLLGARLSAPATNGCTTYYHLADAAPTQLAAIAVDGQRSGPVANSVVLTNVAPSYATENRILVSSTVVGKTAPAETEVRRHLQQLWGVATSGWEHVATYALPDALPAQAPPLATLRRPVRMGDGLYVCGDHRDTASIQGALVSGRRAAQSVLADLGVERKR